KPQHHSGPGGDGRCGSASGIGAIGRIMHYQEFKQTDPRVLKALIEAFPFAAITAQDKNGIVVAYAPVTFKQGSTPNGSIEFHLAKENPIMPLLQNGSRITISIIGPNCQISPSWYKSRFSGPSPDRSKTAPTYNYMAATMQGALQPMDDRQL